MTDLPTVHWTQFPAAAITDRHGNPLDWLDHMAAHKAVSKLFPARLPGEPQARRAEAGVLYRLDIVDAVPTVLVQSLVPPELVPAGHRTITVPGTALAGGVGQRVAFRLAVNPVVRTTRHYEDAAKRTVAHGSNVAGGQATRTGHRKQTARVVRPDEITEWVAAKVAPALGDIEIMSHRRDKTRSGRHQIAIDTIDGVATVTDPNALCRLRLTGVGRSKAYGCGLLTTIALPG